MRGYDHIWSEDDAGTPDRERIEAAFKRITGLDFTTWKEGAEEIDRSDTFEFRRHDSEWVVLLAFDGGHIYRRPPNP